MKAQLVALVFAITPFCFGENLFKNGDMKGGGGWRGDRTFVEENGNRVIELKANKNRKVGFSQEVDTKGVKSVKLSFRYKSQNYEGLGFEVRKNSKGKPGPFTVVKAKVDGNWQTYSSANIPTDNDDAYTFVFSLLEGTGTMLFDDFVIERHP